MTTLRTLGLFLSLSLTVACSSVSVTDDAQNGSGGSGGAAGGGNAGGDGGGGSGGGSACTIDAPGATFTFTFINQGNSPVALAYGCGKNIPIEFNTPAGTQGISPGAIDFCEIDCELVYGGYSNLGCGDCGPGVGVTLQPGASTTIEWDRRLFTDHTASNACTGNADGNNCALGTLIESGAQISGVVTVCSDTNGGGYCSDSNEVAVPITIDTATNGITIDL